MSKHWKRTLSLLAVAAAVGLVSAGLALGVKPPKPPPEPPPSGPGLIAFNNGNDDYISLMNPDGTGVTPVAVTPSIHRRPIWSHAFSDGTVKLGWVVEGPAPTYQSDIWVVDVSPDVGVPTMLTGVPTNSEYGPSLLLDWAPSVVGDDGKDRVRICVADEYMRPEGRYRADLRVVTLIYNSSAGTFTADPDPNAQPVVFAAGDDVTYGTSFGTAQFSPDPDGTWLVFVRSDLDPDGYFSNNRSIWLAKSDGSSQQELVNASGSYDVSPAWSPDGTRLAFLSDRDAKDGVDGMDIYIASLDPTTKEVTSVERLPSRSVRERARGLSWSPDGKQICYCHGGSKFGAGWTNWTIGKVVLETGERSGLSEGGNAYPDWSPMDLSPLP